jgi:hypothetical protein
VTNPNRLSAVSSLESDDGGDDEDNIYEDGALVAQDILRFRQVGINNCN